MTASGEAPTVDHGGPLTWEANREGISALPLRVVSPIDWELDEPGERLRIHLDRLGKDTWYKPRVLPVLEGLEAGEDLPGLVDRMLEANPDLPRRSAIRSARRLVSSLASQGNVEITLPPVPETFAGRFKRVRELGRGGVGVAWLCRDNDRDGSPVVVKHAWNWTGPFQRRDRAIREEAEVLAPLDHPQVAGLVSSFEVDGRMHLARAYVEGRELSEVVYKQGPPAPAERSRLVQDTAAILEHLHERGVLCLDLKPSNLMLEATTDRVILADLGHGRLLDQGRVALEGPWGSRAYAAPEVHRDHVADVASDVYGLGCLLTFLLRRRAPQPGEDVQERSSRLVEAGATRAELRFVEVCLRREPEKRPPSPLAACELLDEGADA